MYLASNHDRHLTRIEFVDIAIELKHKRNIKILFSTCEFTWNRVRGENKLLFVNISKERFSNFEERIKPWNRIKNW